MGQPQLKRAFLLLLLVLPGAAAAVLLPGRLPLWRALLATPMVVLPTLLTLSRLQRHATRAAIGIGAGRLDRLRWIWLPLLGPGLAASLLVLVLLVAACLLT